MILRYSRFEPQRVDKRVISSEREAEAKARSETDPRGMPKAMPFHRKTQPRAASR
jgi:hypothetical protein